MECMRSLQGSFTRNYPRVSYLQLMAQQRVQRGSLRCTFRVTRSNKRMVDPFVHRDHLATCHDCSVQKLILFTRVPKKSTMAANLKLIFPSLDKMIHPIQRIDGFAGQHFHQKSNFSGCIAEHLTLVNFRNITATKGLFGWFYRI